MDREKALEDIKFIRKVLDDSRKLYFDDGIIHILWSCTTVMGTGITWWCVHTDHIGVISPLWIFILLISLAITITIVRKREKRPHNFAGRIYGATWKAAGLGIVLFSSATMIMGYTALNIRLSVIPLLLGAAYYISAQIGVYRWMNGIAAGWFCISIALIFVPDGLSSLLLGAATIPLELVPGIILMKKHRQDSGRNE